MHNACVLILEDSPTERAVLERKLKKLLDPKDRIISTGDGQEAVDKILAMRADPTRPCIFILDLNMPGEIKGFGVLKAIRSMGDYDECPVIILTTSNANADRQTALELGATRYYIKPKSIGEVEALLQSILKEFRNVRPK